MCGIAASFTYDGAPETRRLQLGRISDAMASRGPDGAGEWWSEDGRVGMAHRRLSIIDLSTGGAQPQASPDGQVHIVFNGEIYNYRNLRADLEQRGHRFRTKSDTEVILALYRECGTDMFLKLHGMFAIVLWDAKSRRLLLARDPLGIKPLYFSDAGGTVQAASQVKALVAGGGVDLAPDRAGWAGFLIFGSVPEPFTTYRAVRAVPAGSFMVASETGCSPPQQYASVPAALAQGEKSALALPPREACEQAREAFRESVRRHLVSDVPVGAFLSSGVDSSALVGLMRDLGQMEIRTVTLAFKEFVGRPGDETLHAQEIADLYGARHTTCVVTREQFKRDWPTILASMDQPSIDGVNTWLVSKATRELGLKVALSGVGGDELLGSYPSFLNVPRAVSWLGGVRSQGVGRFVRKTLTQFGSRFGGKRASLLEYGGDFAAAYLLQRAVLMPWEVSEWLGRDAEEAIEELDPIGVVRRAMTPEPRTAFGKVAALETSLYMRNQLLRDTDWAGMANSVEIRTPLADWTLLNNLAPLLPPARPWAAKAWLANAPSNPVPRQIAARRKTGFGVPMRQWMDDGASSGGGVAPSWQRSVLSQVLATYSEDPGRLLAA